MEKKKLLLFILITALLLLSFSLNSTAENLKIHFIDVGQGDSILIEAAGGEKILVDGGDRADSIALKIIKYLKAQKIKELDYLISTHPHADHIGGLGDIIENFKVKKVLDSGRIHTSKTYENYLIKIDQENIAFDTPRQGDQFQLKEGELIFLHPDQKIESYSLNNSSLVFLLKYKNQNFLFTGDIEAEIERKLLSENPKLRVDLIKVPHHGSKNSSFTDWIKSLQAETAVVQLGADNHYGHPAAEVIEVYQNQGAQVFRNDLNGNIVVTADGRNYAVKVDQSQEKIYGTEKKSASQAKAPAKSKDENKDLININKASASILDQLWGIGPSTAEKIINYREKNGEFKTTAEIKQVDGISEGKFRRWQHKITVN